MMEPQAEGAVAPRCGRRDSECSDKLQLSGIQGMEGGTNSFGQGSKLIVDDSVCRLRLRTLQCCHLLLRARRYSRRP